LLCDAKPLRQAEKRIAGHYGIGKGTLRAYGRAGVIAGDAYHLPDHQIVGENAGICVDDALYAYAEAP
jgi:hypothetical protein